MNDESDDLKEFTNLLSGGNSEQIARMAEKLQSKRDAALERITKEKMFIQAAVDTFAPNHRPIIHPILRPGTVFTTPHKSSGHSKQVLDIAQDLHAKGIPVTTKVIRERLVAAGDTRRAQVIGISSGNILYQSKIWRKRLRASMCQSKERRTLNSVAKCGGRYSPFGILRLVSGKKK